MANDTLFLRLSYRLTTIDTEDGEATLCEEMTEDRPLIFVSGLGVMLEPFEQALTAVDEGAVFDFTIPCAQAFGPWQEDRVIALPREQFLVDGRFDARRVFEGAVIPLQAPDGQLFKGIVLNVDEESVTLDLNHPNAGMDLHYEGRLLTKRAATAEEITQMLRLLSGEGGCGGGCGGCGGGCHECNG